MKVGEMKRELESYGVVGNFIEKGEMIEALQKARARRPAATSAQSEPQKTSSPLPARSKSKPKIKLSAGYVVKSKNSSKINRNISEMSVKELKFALEKEHGISTHGFLEKADLVNALEEARKNATKNGKPKPRQPVATQAGAAPSFSPLQGNVAFLSYCIFHTYIVLAPCFSLFIFCDIGRRSTSQVPRPRKGVRHSHSYWKLALL